MAARSRKIFWGILLASVHINLFDAVVLFPSCLGMAIFYFGILDLEKGGGLAALTERERRALRALSAALVIVTGFLNFRGIFLVESDGSIWDLLPCILEYMVFSLLLEGYTAGKPDCTGLRRGYLLVMGACLSGLGASLIAHSSFWQFFCSVILLICRLMVLGAVRRDGRELMT